MAFVLKKPREFVLAHPEIRLSWWQKFRFIRLLKKRQRGIPLAYLLGHKEFFGLDFLVNKNTLIPRPETEIMVEAVLEIIKNANHNVVLIDVGTGSGCIPISIIKNAQKKIRVITTDISSSALRIAQKNASQNNVDITFLHGNLLEPIYGVYPELSRGKSILPSMDLPESFVIITANLPYLRAEQFKKEPTIQYEPRLALVANNNGLGLYEKLLEQIKQHLTSVKIKNQIQIFLEIDPAQKDAIKKIIQAYFSTALIEIKTDLAEQDRLVVITLV